MGVLRRALGIEESGLVTALSEAQQTIARMGNDLEIATESFANAELALEDRGWQRLADGAENEFTREGLRNASRLCRVVAVQDALVNRGLNVRQAYVWGQGVQIQARATGIDGEQDVNAVVQAFLDEPGNQAAFTGDQAQEELERALGTDGNVFIACFTSPLTGFVRVRSTPFDEITEVVHNPEDRDDPWFYRRQWTQTEITSEKGHTVKKSITMDRYYPALGFRPKVRPKSVDGIQVEWDAPIYHVSVNRLDGWTFGIGDAYPALPWARLSKDFLVDWAVLMKSLSQIAWQVTTKGGKQSQQARAKLQRTTPRDPQAGNPGGAGATVTVPEGTSIEAIPKTGATIDADSGKPLTARIAAALGVPLTTLTADAGQTGARAVAETLNFPMELAMRQRQSLWAETYRAVLGYAIHQAAKAPQGPLLGTLGRDPFTGRETLTLANDTDATIEVVFPPLDQVSIDVIIKAIVEADSTGKMPPLETLKLLLHALRVKDADEIIDAVTDDDGNWLDPSLSVAAAVGQRAVDAFRAGADPAEAVR